MKSTEILKFCAELGWRLCRPFEKNFPTSLPSSVTYNHAVHAPASAVTRRGLIDGSPFVNGRKNAASSLDRASAVLFSTPEICRADNSGQQTSHEVHHSLIPTDPRPNERHHSSIVTQTAYSLSSPLFPKGLPQSQLVDAPLQ